MRFGLLGPVVVANEDVNVEVTSTMPRTVLAVLLLNADSVVSIDQLVEVLWGDGAPASATASLHNHVMRLRRLLGDEGGARIRAVAPGYLIHVEPGELDLDVFAARCAAGAQAVRAGQWAKASQDLTAALALWRGDPAADVPSVGGQDSRVQHLVEARLQAFEGRIEADLELGRQREVIGELRTLTAQHPLREVFHRQLMLALYRADRQAEALEVFQGLRRTLVEELGVEPSASVQQLHRRILNADPELDAPAPAPADLTAAAQVPAAEAHSGRGGPRYQLPADTRVFTGRVRELEELIGLASAAPVGTASGMVVISAIDGMAGIGKTTLAVHAAHRIRDRFPDGQLFLDLHGYTTGLEPMAAEDALDWLLRSLGVPPPLIPTDLGDRAAFYRDRLDGTRTLIILDNASSTAQVRPLLPSAPGCLVLVTSRKRLTGLDDAFSLALDVMPQQDAIALLHKVAGPGRIPPHHPAIMELIELCGQMPLAIRITAARLRHHRSLRIEDVVRQLRDDNARLQHLKDGERNLTAVFDSSYLALPTAEQHLFRLLSQVPGPDVDASAAANLAATDQRTAERLLESILDHNLLTQRTPGRYRFHDLIRVYARGLTGDAPGDQEAALERLLDYYQYSVEAADRHLTQHNRSIPAISGVAGAAPSATPPVAVPDLPDNASALAWMRAERANLLAAVARITADGPASRVVALTAAMAAFLHQEGPWQQVAALHQTAANIAHEDGDRLAEATALWDLGRVWQMTGDTVTAISLHERALAIFQELGHRPGEANALQDLGHARRPTGDFPALAALHERALTIYQELGDRLGEATALCDLGRLRYLTGDFPASADLENRSLAIFRELGNRLGEGKALQDLGRVWDATGDFPAAVTELERALAIFQDLGHALGEGSALCDLGHALIAQGELAAAAQLLERALVIFRDLGLRPAEATALRDLGWARLESGEYAAAAELLNRSLAIFQELGHSPRAANVLAVLGRLRRLTGDYPGAAATLEQALDIRRDLGLRHDEAELLIDFGALVAESTGPREALTLYQQALTISMEVRSPLEEARAQAGIARCAATLGDHTMALAAQREAAAISRRIGAPEADAEAAYLAELQASIPDPR